MQVKGRALTCASKLIRTSLLAIPMPSPVSIQRCEVSVDAEYPKNQIYGDEPWVNAFVPARASGNDEQATK